MKTIFKYEIKFGDLVSVELPKGAEILTVNELADSLANRTLYLWAIIDDNVKEFEIRNIRISGTGHSLEQEKLKYINTVFLLDKTLVFHIFEVLK